MLQRLPFATPAVALVLVASLTGCANMSDRQRHTAIGAGVGAAAGAAIGDSSRGAVIGAVAGAVAGNLWSRHMQEKQRAMEQATQGTGASVVRTEDNQLKIEVPSDISFAVNSATIEPRLRSVLDTFAQGLSDQSGMRVRVVGHTDNTGSDAINDPLSLRRAEAVRSYVADRGVQASRVDVAGRGAREPVASNDTADGRARNRRVEIFLRDSQAAGQ